jgi:hypothetical protein
MCVKERLRIALREGRSRAEMWATGKAAARGYELRRRHFYLPFPDVERLPESLWTAASPTPGVDLAISDGVALLRQIAPYMREFGETRFPIPNGSYEWVDAETLYGMLRHLKPRRLIELGSGASSRLIATAQATNAKEGAPFKFESFDPYPGWNAIGNVPGVTVRAIPAETLDPAALNVLERGDVLFVDTTHTVKTGGDVTHITLDILPRLAPGVYVHVHDIFLPYEYPREWVVDHRRAWAEQYILQAFLAFNPLFEVVLPVHAITRQHPDAVREAIPSFSRMQGTGPGAFWIRRTDAVV